MIYWREFDHMSLKVAPYDCRYVLVYAIAETSMKAATTRNRIPTT